MAASDYTVHVLHVGYSRAAGRESRDLHANCTCTLIKGRNNVIVDTMTPWDGDVILRGLAEHGLEPKDVAFVVSTHGHSDHCGNNNLFLEAVHIMGYCVSRGTTYFDHDFAGGVAYEIDEHVRVVPTPGHTLSHVSVVVSAANGETIVVAGDLFENEDDVRDANIWKSAGSEDEVKQAASREKILKMADKIIPGHGRMFAVRK